VNNSKNAEINSFVNNIRGYSEYSKRKSEFKQNDLPIGIKILDHVKFSLTIINADDSLLDKLSSDSFYIFRITESERIFGTGPFEIDYSNGDIIYELRKNIFYNIDVQENSFSGLNIRFIKNKSALINEFLNESIDIVHYKSFNESVVELDSLISKTYGLKNIVTQDSTTVQYLTFHNFKNSHTVDLILNQVELDRSLNYKISNEKHNGKKGTLTSSDIIPVINNTTHNYTEWLQVGNTKFASKLNLLLKDKLNINLIDEYIVINECRIKMKGEKPDQNILRIIFRSSERNISALAIINYQHDLIIFSQNITGFKNYGNWIEDIKGLTYSQPLAY
jgi:hypothetical protein